MKPALSILAAGAALVLLSPVPSSPKPRPEGGFHPRSGDSSRPGIALAGTTWVQVYPSFGSPCDAPAEETPSTHTLDEVFCFEGVNGDSTWPLAPAGKTWTHWSRQDPPEPAVSPWHVSTELVGGSNGLSVARLGCDGDSWLTGGCGKSWSWSKSDGYGNLWNWSLALDASGQDASSGGTVQFDIRYDMECGYDRLFLEVFDGFDWLPVQNASGDPVIFTGVSGVQDSLNGGTGRICDGDVLGSSDEIASPGDAHGLSAWTTVNFPLPVLASGPIVRWRGESDRYWSDEDGSGATDGLASIDNLLITFTASGSVVTDDFETGDFLGVQATAGPTPTWSLPAPTASTYDGWHLEFDPQYVHHGNTPTFSNDWMWSSTPAAGPLPENGFDFLLVSPPIEVSGWTG